MKPLLLAPLLMWVSAVIGCGGDDEGTDDPRVQCETFRDALCSRHSECMKPTDRARGLEDCLFVLKLDLDCGSVGRVTSAYGECLAALSNAKCEAAGGIQMPTSCQGILIAKGGF
ncbi:MAG: hypothetical protein ABW133_15905 [Polyangiaceae bacterium]